MVTTAKDDASRIGDVVSPAVLELTSDPHFKFSDLMTSAWLWTLPFHVRVRIIEECIAIYCESDERQEPPEKEEFPQYRIRRRRAIVVALRPDPITTITSRDSTRRRSAVESLAPSESDQFEFDMEARDPFGDAIDAYLASPCPRALHAIRERFPDHFR